MYSTVRQSTYEYSNGLLSAKLPLQIECAVLYKNVNHETKYSIHYM
jgi:hypothetical protein